MGALPYPMVTNSRHQLFRLHFPQLRFLGISVYESDSGENADELIEFLVSHGATLEELNYAFSPSIRSSGVFHDSRILQVDSLPHLKSYRGTSLLLEQMIQKRMFCLQSSLEKAVVHIAGRRDCSSIMETFLNATHKSSHSPFTLDSLRELDIDRIPWNEQSRDLILEFLIRTGKLCSRSLEVWCGTFYADVDPERLGQAFSYFKSLHTIWLREDNIGTNNAETYTLILASWCPKLKTVLIANRDELHDGDYSQRISISREAKYPFITNVEHGSGVLPTYQHLPSRRARSPSRSHDAQ